MLMVKKIFALLLCSLWIGFTFYRPGGIFQPVGSLFTYSTGVFSLRAPDAEPGTLELKSEGRHEVDIRIDSIGIPHIYGKTADAAAFGMGYMHARDRYFQMEIITRVVQGRLAELLGNNAVSSDIFWRPLEIETKAQEVLEELKADHPRVYAQVMAYNEGVTFYLASEEPRHHSPEYRMLGAGPRGWEPHYPLLLSWYMSYMLTYTDKDVEREQVLKNLPSGLADALYETGNDNYPYIVPDTVFTAQSSQPESILLTGVADPLLKAETIGERELRQSIGSNNWAVSASKSATGSAMLCNDTHLDIALPNPWYEAHVVCPEFNVYGFSIPCSPFIISGYNENIAWGITNSDWDLTDRYLLKINPSNENEYWYEDAWKKMEEREYRISQSNREDTIIRQRFTVFGRVIKGEKEAYAQKWYPAAKNISVVSFDVLTRAKGWEDFQKALSYYSYPPQNFAYADKWGNTGIISAGKVPLRHEGFKGGLLDGTRMHEEKFVPFASLPQQFKPVRSFVYSANQKPARTSYYLDYDWHEPYRAERIRQLLAQDKKLSVEDMKAIQADRTDIASEEIKALIGKYGTQGEKWKLLEPLKNWNGLVRASSREALIQSYFIHFIRTRFQDILKSEYGVADIVPANKLYAFLQKNDTLDIGKKKVNVRQFLEECITAAEEQLQQDFGKDHHKADYSHFVTFNVRHFVRFPGLGATVPDAGGNANTPNVNTQRVHGASMRTIITMNEKPEALTVLAGGQSGRPNSPNYKNQLEAWKAVEYHAAQFSAKQEELRSIKNIIHIKANE